MTEENLERLDGSVRRINKVTDDRDREDEGDEDDTARYKGGELLQRAKSLAARNRVTLEKISRMSPKPQRSGSETERDDDLVPRRPEHVRSVTMTPQEGSVRRRERLVSAPTSPVKGKKRTSLAFADEVGIGAGSGAFLLPFHAM